jgi:hypothetical protein
VKSVMNNDGGTAAVDDWTLSATAPSPNDGRNFDNPGGSGVFETVYANAAYSLSETDVAGYQAGGWSCSGGTLVGSTLTLALDEDVTCHITNNDIAPTLKLVKDVVNDDGGDAEADDWTLSATAAAPNDGRNFDNLGGSGAFQAVFANAGYDLSETSVAGYTPEDWSCNGGTLVDSTVTLALDEDVTCTITNDDIAPELTIVKVVEGSEPPSWSFTGTDPIGTFSLPAAGGSSDTYQVMANQPYAVTEAAVNTGDLSTAWVLTDITCDDGTAGSLKDRSVSVTMDPGDEVTCTFTNKKAAIAIDKQTADNYGNEGDSLGILPGETVTWNYYVTNTGNVPLENVSVVDDQGVTVTCPQDMLDVGESMTCMATGITGEGWYNNTGTASGDYTDDEGNTTTVTAEDPSSYYGLTPGAVTNSSLCDFGDQFRLIFTPDMKNYTASNPAYKLSDSNPGQFFYNQSYVNDGTPATEFIQLEIPYPFVTQGANPVHVYGGLFVNESGGYNCFDPTNELAAYGLVFGLGDYTDTNDDGVIGYGDVYVVEVPAELDFQYVNIHLDYGLEKTDGWIRKGANVSNDPLINPDPLLDGVSIVDNTPHTFQAYADDVLIDDSTDTVYNLNEFKQIRGFGGLVYYWTGNIIDGEREYIGLEGAQVQLIGPDGTVLETMTTDSDGWYLSDYIHKGKAATYTLRLLAGTDPNGTSYPQQEVLDVLVGGRIKFGEGNFWIPPLP